MVEVDTEFQPSPCAGEPSSPLRGVDAIGFEAGNRAHERAITAVHVAMSRLQRRHASTAVRKTGHLPEFNADTVGYQRQDSVTIAG
jgi:hypothetical protein